MATRIVRSLLVATAVAAAVGSPMSPAGANILARRVAPLLATS
jgi:hypothetical protein